MPTFTPELTFGPWTSGILTDSPAQFRTIVPTSSISTAWLLSGGIWADSGVWSDSNVWED